MTTVSVAQAKNRLCELLELAAKGERVTVLRYGRPVADIVQTTTPDTKPPKKAPEPDLADWLRGGNFPSCWP